MFADNKPQEGFAYLAEMARSASGRGIAADMWFSEVKSMPVSKASVQALQQFLLQFPTGSVAANARVLLDQQQAQLQDPTFRARSEGLAAVKSGNTTQAVADLQKAVQADSRDSDAVGALGQLSVEQCRFQIGGQIDALLALALPRVRLRPSRLLLIRASCRFRPRPPLRLRWHRRPPQSLPFAK